MKKLMFAISLAGLLGLGASAAVESANTFGVLKVESSTKETIICVPWVAVGTTGADIPVSDLVMTSNLTAGDALYYYDATQGKYKAWILDSNGTWGAPKIVESVGSALTETDPESVLAARGDALVLVRKEPKVNNVAKPIYLYGQYESTSAQPPTLVKGAWNLIAPPQINTDGTDVNTGMTWSGVKTGDQLRIQNAAGYVLTLEYVNNLWTFVSGPNIITEGLKIRPGMGAWYVSKGGSGDPQPSVSFTAPASGN